MAKKRKATRPSEPAGPRAIDPTDARLQISTYEDIADDQEQYFLEKDRILLEDEPRKRLRAHEKEDEFFEPSDDEVLAADDDSDESDREDDEAYDGAADKVDPGNDGGSDEEQQGEEEGEEEGDEGYWGSSRNDWYNAEELESETQALEEEKEARRLQKLKMKKMQDADFIFDQDEWLAPTGQAAEGDGVVTEAIKDIEITDDMPPEEQYRLLQARYPEFAYLADEFQELQPLLAVYQKEADGRPSKSLEVIRFRVLGCYLASLGCYLAILTAPARDGNGSSKLLSQSELRDHEVMETLVSCRETWLKVKSLKLAVTTNGSVDDASLQEAEDRIVQEAAEEVPNNHRVRGDKALLKEEKKKKKAAEKQKAAEAQKIEESLADLSSLLTKSKRPSKSKPASAGPGKAEEDNRSDFGEEDAIDARTGADKAARKKSLRFYTSQIVQKSQRRAGASRDAGGDTDIPYRERLKDRQARLNAEAERRGKKASKPGAELGGGSDDDEAGAPNGTRDDDDEYYDMVFSASKKKKEDKAARREALTAATTANRFKETVVGADGKRKITYNIEKNKGLTPRRKKEVRNPRVKKRMKFEEKKKKVASQKATWKGGEARGGYAGELSGIKTGLIKSIKL